VTDPTAGSRDATPDPALFGDLSRFTVSDLMQFCGFLGLTGVLEFSHSGEETQESVRLRLQRGRIIEALAEGPHLRIGELLVRRYEVSLDTVMERLRHQSEARTTSQPVSRLGELLVEAGEITPEILRQALDEAATRVACRVLTWKEGRFAYWPEESQPPAGVNADVGLEDLVLERWHATDTYS
jgi:hypothetical protein